MIQSWSFAIPNGCQVCSPPIRIVAATTVRSLRNSPCNVARRVRYPQADRAKPTEPNHTHYYRDSLEKKILQLIQSSRTSIRTKCSATRPIRSLKSPIRKKKPARHRWSLSGSAQFGSSLCLFQISMIGLYLRLSYGVVRIVDRRLIVQLCIHTHINHIR